MDKATVKPQNKIDDIDNISGGQAIGYVGGALLLIVFLVIAVRADDGSLNLLYVFVPLVLGWACGILFTPQGEGQSSQFRTIAGGVAALFSGFIIGRFEPLLEPFKSPGTWTVLYQERLMLALGSFILGALFTSIGRINNLNPFRSAPAATAQSSAAAVPAGLQPLSPAEPSASPEAPQASDSRQ